LQRERVFKARFKERIWKVAAASAAAALVPIPRLRVAVDIVLISKRKIIAFTRPSFVFPRKGRVYPPFEQAGPEKYLRPPQKRKHWCRNIPAEACFSKCFPVCAAQYFGWPLVSKL